MRFEVPVAMNF